VSAISAMSSVTARACSGASDVAATPEGRGEEGFAPCRTFGNMWSTGPECGNPGP
jgi:hypothetical protein